MDTVFVASMGKFCGGTFHMADKTDWQPALQARDDLNQYGDNAIGLFALAIHFAIDDIHTVAADSLTDGRDDKKTDIIYIDREEGIAVVAQCYKSIKQRQSAPANKASDLNTALAWLLQRRVQELPTGLRSQASELRDAIGSGAIRRLEAWYVHNLPESANVQSELDTVEHTARSLTDALKPPKHVVVSALEVGDSRLGAWYRETLSPILVNDAIEFSVESGFEIKSDRWSAYVSAVQGRELRSLFKKYNTDLFSANVRDYLGSRRSDTNINHGIKNTAENQPADFWVFNNGITILTHAYEVVSSGRRKVVRITGASVVNGAQTTGALSSLSKAPSKSALVPARFVSTNDTDLIDSIVQYNNSQNKITASDFRSTDRIQKRLREEMSKIPNATYEGGRRGGSRDVIARNKNLLPSYTVGQALASFSGDPIIAYNQKSEIWINDKLYAKYFNEDTTAEHIIFAYGLLRAVEEAKKSIVSKARSDADLTGQEKSFLEYVRKRGATYLLTSAIASCLETLLNKHISNIDRASFGDRKSPADATLNWSAIVKVVSPFTKQLSDAISDGLKNAEKISDAIGTFRSLVEATADANRDAYSGFSRLVRIRKSD